MKRLKTAALSTGIIVLTAVSVVVAQTVECPALVEIALAQAESTCGEIGRNQACYGHINIEASPLQEDQTLPFEQVGDVVDLTQIGRLRMSPLDVSNGQWGVALLRVQANLPDTLPGQNVTMLMFGDIELENRGELQQEVPTAVLAGGAANIRIFPTTESAVLRTVPDGFPLLVIGRDRSDDWLLVITEEDGPQGWISRELTAGVDDLSVLPVVSPGETQYGPMQAFLLKTGAEQPSCSEAPVDGILLQTPPNAGPVHMVINDVDVTFGSTLFIRANAGSNMVVSVVEGAAVVESDGVDRPMVEGGRVRIPMDDNLRPAAEPGLFEPYDMTVLAPLPVDELERDIEIAPSVNADEAALMDRYAPYFERVALSHYRDLFAFLRENPDAADSEVIAFIAALAP